ncbi:MAG: hypothetical protein IJ660_05085 [Alphaproteobacteria bacterium]|nr:hypothetical protein [Alphaproteobacteria bacterium]
MKKFLLLISMILILSACEKKEEQPAPTPESQIQVTLPEDLSILYSYQHDNLHEECTNNNEIVCAIETIVKCALNPKLSVCDSKTMPEFLFYDDSIFAQDDVEGRPTEQSFKLLKYKPLDNHTIEIYTEGTCDHNWFGACKGNIIYVMDNSSGQWLVKDLYAVEKIH